MRLRLVVAGVLALGVVSAAAATPGLVLRHPRGAGYQVLLPPSWKFRDASYPSDHTTQLWTSPADRNAKLEVVIAACVGCVTKNFDGKTPAPEQEAPAHAQITKRSRWEVAFLARTQADP